MFAVHHPLTLLWRPPGRVLPDPGSMMVTLKLLGRLSLSDSNGPVAGQITQRRRLAFLAILGASPHAIHGVGWQRPWRVDAAAPDTVLLSLEHASGGVIGRVLER